MYKLKPYDLSDKFRLIPNREKYSLTFCQNNSVNFKSKREAYDFISKISNFFLEVLQISEIIQMQINSYRYHFSPKNKSTSDKYNLFAANDLEINKTISELKHFQNSDKEIYKLEMKYSNLLYFLRENVEILLKQVPKAVSHIFILIDNICTSYSHVLKNAENLYRKNSLSIFIK